MKLNKSDNHYGTKGTMWDIANDEGNDLYGHVYASPHTVSIQWFGPSHLYSSHMETLSFRLDESFANELQNVLSSGHPEALVDFLIENGCPSEITDEMLSLLD